MPAFYLLSGKLVVSNLRLIWHSMAMPRVNLCKCSTSSSHQIYVFYVEFCLPILWQYLVFFTWLQNEKGKKADKLRRSLIKDPY